MALNRAVAVAMRDGPAALEGYHLIHAARADFLRRLNRKGEAQAAYQRAQDLAVQEPERRFLERRVGELSQ